MVDSLPTTQDAFHLNCMRVQIYEHECHVKCYLNLPVLPLPSRKMLPIIVKYFINNFHGIVCVGIHSTTCSKIQPGNFIKTGRHLLSMCALVQDQDEEPDKPQKNNLTSRTKAPFALSPALSRLVPVCVKFGMLPRAAGPTHRRQLPVPSQFESLRCPNQQP